MLTVLSTGGLAQGTVSVSPSGEINYTPPFMLNGDDQFTYTISDTGLLTLEGVSTKHTLSIQLKKIPLSDFRLLGRKFHWVNESTYNY